MFRCSYLHPHLLDRHGDLLGARVASHAPEDAQEHPPSSDVVLRDDPCWPNPEPILARRRNYRQHPSVTRPQLGQYDLHRRVDGRRHQLLDPDIPRHDLAARLALLLYSGWSSFQFRFVRSFTMLSSSA